eukprot:2264061-Prymnesium_polylepis.1
MAPRGLPPPPSGTTATCCSCACCTRRASWPSALCSCIRCSSSSRASWLRTPRRTPARPRTRCSVRERARVP